MTAGWIKLIRDDIVVDSVYYAGKKHRDRIIAGWRVDYEQGEKESELIIQIAPNSLNKTIEKAFLEYKEYIMKPGQKLICRTGRSKYRVPEGKVKEEEKQIILRPPTNYTNGQRVKQYFH